MKTPREILHIVLKAFKDNFTEHFKRTYERCKNTWLEGKEKEK